MPEDIRVHVVKYQNRVNLVMRYVDPLTGRQVARSAKTPRRREAEREAAKWEAELREGRYQKPSRLTWSDFRERYEDEHLATLSARTFESSESALNHLERVVAPKLLASLTADVLSRFRAALLAEGMKPTTLASHLRSIRAALNWAARKKLLREAPDVEMPKAAQGIERTMRGRPITLEEFERMLAAVPKVRKREPQKWQRLLCGLWYSGLRIGEALQLSWDADAPICVRLDGKYPKLRIWSEAQKRKQDTLLPIAPEFAEFLLETPPAARHGLVFGIEGTQPGKPLSTARASRYISAVGVQAGVVVDPVGGQTRVDKETGQKTSPPKYASAHDLRRAFGTRWSKLLMPAELKQLMRHRSIETTMKYYVEHDADEVSASLWKAAGFKPSSTSGSSEHKPDLRDGEASRLDCSNS